MPRPSKTLADYIVVTISPLLIMLLVGSLAFFLIQVFYRGAMVHGIRWLMFWFVLAIVLVSRIGIEQGRGHAQVYGVALAAVTWLYLWRTHGTLLLGALLLAVTWWCGHRLTVDCTLISEDEDASGEGVLQGLWNTLEKVILMPQPPPKLPPLSPLDGLVIENLSRRRSVKPARAPGRAVVWFSLAALPLFGMGQLFLPADDPQARHAGFAFLAVYLVAALGLLATTSFLGLRRYLRQRSTEMPSGVAVAWMKFGLFISTGVLLLALILPRPGANFTWKELTYRIESRQHKANDHALPFNPPGESRGAPGELAPEQQHRVDDSRKPASGSGGSSPAKDDRAQPNSNSNPEQTGSADGGTGSDGRQGSSGDQGQENTSGSGTGRKDAHGDSPRGSITVKDSTGPAGGDDSGGIDRGADSGDSTGTIRDGRGGVQSEPSQDRRGAQNSQRRQRSYEQKDVSGSSAPPEDTTPSEREPDRLFARLLRALIIISVAALFIWFLFRHRKIIGDMTRSLVKAMGEFFRRLLSLRWRRKAEPTVVPDYPQPTITSFASYENPFLTGKDGIWSPERLLCYTYEALGSWARDQRIIIRPQETPREFCRRVLERFPDFGEDLDQFAFYYTHVAFARRLPDDLETESIRRVWQYLGDSIPVMASR